ncbi:hypothetical protein LMG27177_06864 [Paraburkholderia fynbosensis]|uniref:Uncharacterized protein n=1 Tax=Paraburkholderia fynbosensis TaxID=1200993 RepID=A0A6J5GZ56_9BURK|nr:hypothetical protein LMG27177_06864 [Paraburkholderia fynbosensis]
MVPDIGFQLFGCPSPPSVVPDFHVINQNDLKCACNNQQSFA